MTAAELTSQILALPADQRAAIAQRVWESIEGEEFAISPQADAEALAVSQRRDDEMSNCEVSGRSHEEVIKNARRAIE